MRYVIERISKSNQSMYWTGNGWTDMLYLATRYADVPSTWRIIKILAVNADYHYLLLQVD